MMAEWPIAANEFTPACAQTATNAAPIPAFKRIDPKQLFEQHLQDAKNAGIQISSQKKRKGTRKVMFKDGGKLMLSKDGVMIHKYADGKKVQCTPDGKSVTVRPSMHGCGVHLHPHLSLSRHILCL